MATSRRAIALTLPRDPEDEADNQGTRDITYVYVPHITPECHPLGLLLGNIRRPPSGWWLHRLGSLEADMDNGHMGMARGPR
ncbi:hypothetical protein GCM10022206_75120 [Streptomyces chiangmaiensis]